MKTLLLVVDHDENFREALRLICENIGIEFSESRSPERALNAIARGLRPHIILTEVSFPMASCAEFITRVKAILRDSCPPIFLCTSESVDRNIFTTTAVAGVISKTDLDLSWLL